MPAFSVETGNWLLGHHATLALRTGILLKTASSSSPAARRRRFPATINCPELSNTRPRSVPRLTCDSSEAYRVGEQEGRNLRAVEEVSPVGIDQNAD